MSSRIIRLVTPNNQAFKIDLRGKENELIDLISMITGICRSDIKGIKDCFGNYYTISSAINNPHLNSEFSEVYFLLCKFDSEFADNRQTNGYNSNGKTFSMNSLNSPYHFNSKPIGKTYRVKNFLKSSNNSNLFQRNNHRWYEEKYNNRTTSDYDHNREYPSDKYNIHKKSETDYVNFCNRNNSENENFGEKLFFSQNNFREKSSEKQTIKNIVKDIQSNEILNETEIVNMNQMIKEENEDILILFKVYSQNIIDRKSLVSGLKKILQKNPNNKISTEFLVERKEKLNYLFDQFVTELCNDEEDVTLLKNLIEYENEFIMKAFDVYEEEGDLEKFKDSLQKELKNRNKAFKKKNHFSINMNNKLENDVSVSLDKKTEEKIISSLHTEERIIFKYAIKNNFEEIKLLSRLYEAFKKEEFLIKPIKLFCKKFIEENVIMNLDDFQKSLFYELLTSRNQILLEIFKKFKEHNKLDKLEKEIIYLISKHDSRSSIETSKNSKDFSPKKRISSSEGSDIENSLVDKEQNKPMIQNNSIREFINLVNVMNFLKPEEKKEFEASINKNNANAIQLVNDYFQTKNIMSIKSSLLSMFRKNKNNSDNSIQFCDKIENKKDKEDTSSISRNSGSKMKNYEMNFKLESFAKVLENLVKSHKISSAQQKKLSRRYEYQDEKILSVWEVYKHNNNLNDLAESLCILSKKIKREKSPLKLSATPEILSKSKKEIQEFFKNRNVVDEKEELKIKQMNIIKILEKESLIDHEQLGIIQQMIDDENHLLISAFEVLSVTKDHDEFCDTLNAMCKNYKNNEIKNENTLNKIILNPIESNEIKLNNFFKDFLTHTQNFNENEKNILAKLYSNKNEFILSALELFEKEGDEIEFVDSLNIVLKIQKKN